MKNCKFLLICGMAVLLLFTACLNPIAFDPEQAIATVRVTGDLGFYDTNNAILWILNCTQTVNIDDLTISVEPYPSYDQPEGYPITYSHMPLHGTSLATYHKPANDKSQIVPYFYTVTVGVHDQRMWPKDPVGDSSVTPDESFLEHTKQLPKPGENYKIYLVRMHDGTLALVEDEVPPAEMLDATDYVAAPEPSPLETPLYPIIVRNRTQTAQIDCVQFGNVIRGNPVVMGDQYGYYLEANKYITHVDYSLVGVPADIAPGKTTTHNVEIIRETDMSAQSVHLLYLDFYRTTNGQYRITQSWDADGPNGPRDLDLESLYNGNFDFANVRLVNESSGHVIYAVSAQQEMSGNWQSSMGKEYIIDYSEFYPEGPVSRRDSKIAGFRQFPDKMVEFGLVYGAPYTINVYVQTVTVAAQTEYKVVSYPGHQLFTGRTLDIIVDDQDILNAEGSQQKFSTPFANWRDNNISWSAIARHNGDTTGNHKRTSTIDVIFEGDPGTLNDGSFSLHWDKDGKDKRWGRATIPNGGVARASGNSGHGRLDSAGNWIPGAFNTAATPIDATYHNYRVMWTITIDATITGRIRLIYNGQHMPDSDEPDGKDIFIIGHHNPKTNSSDEAETTTDSEGNVDPDPDPSDDNVPPYFETASCATGTVGIPVTSVQIISDATIKANGEWYEFRVQILPANATNKELRWSKGVLVDPDSVDFRWIPDTTGNMGTLRVMMSSQYREKKDQLPRQANKLDMMVWSDNCNIGLTGITSGAPQNYSVEEGILYVWGAPRTPNGTYLTSGNFPPIFVNLAPLYSNPPSLDQWNDLVKGKIDSPNQRYMQTQGVPYRQPKVKIGIDNSSF